MSRHSRQATITIDPTVLDTTAVALFLRNVTAISAYQHSVSISFCRQEADGDGLMLGCHRLDSHPEPARRGWHLDKTRGYWWRLTEHGALMKRAEFEEAY